jgi:multimeric flavodoxin WrbA
MIWILGIVGSPRVTGNNERLVAIALKAAAEAGAETESLRLAATGVKPCTACASCRQMGDCVILNEFPRVFAKMVAADGIILATPVYFGSATPEMKALLDRAGYLSIAQGRVLENKVGGPLVVARRAGHNFTFAQLLFFFLHQGMLVPAPPIGPSPSAVNRVTYSRTRMA